ncbi:helix-turn-helix domain-containing protein [Lactiplantibacillus plantarum]|uniref:helix-turn-helix domain-containing protein n=1 Tax=Lactiplantibacillus plantarum TaxID=1590 RepID=UPI0040358D95
MSKIEFRISLKAARINAGLRQDQVATRLSDYFGTKVSRQRVSNFESNPENVPRAYGDALARLYGIPVDYLKFVHGSTLGYTADSA